MKVQDSALDHVRRTCAAARRFGVGRSTVYRWVGTARDEKRREAKLVHDGPAPRIQGLAETHGVRVHQ